MVLTPAMRQRLTVLFASTLPFVGGFVAGFIALLTSPEHAPRDFFEIAAQIIVVLLLAAGLQARLLSARVGPLPPPIEVPPNPSDLLQALLRVDRRITALTGATYALGAAVILVAGEFAALGVLLGKAMTGNPRLPMFCIAYGLVALTITVLLAARDDGDATSR